MLASIIQSYGLVAIAVIVSAVGMGCLLRGVRIAGRRSRGECVQCGYRVTAEGATPPDAPPTSASVPSSVCTECGRDPRLDGDATRRSAALVALGLAAQFVWILLGVRVWTPAAVLLVETSVMLTVFALEPALDRLRLAAGGAPRIGALPRRPLLRSLALITVLGGWGWVTYRYERGDRLSETVSARTPGTPLLRVRVESGTEWLSRVLPPALVRNVRVTGLIAEVTPQTTVAIAPELPPRLHALWINGSISAARRFIDPNAVSELRLRHLDDETLLGTDLPLLPQLDGVRILSLEGSSVGPAAIDLLLDRLPNLELLRVPYLNRAEADELRTKRPQLVVEIAERRSRGTVGSVSR
jgi:hypothetical protein